MQNHLDQATHNRNFHNCIHTTFSDKFFDWKITVIFYTAIHLLKALAAKRGINIGETHSEIEKNCNPDRHNATMRITKGAWREYKNLYRYSHTARYEGITDMNTFEKIKEIDYGYCLTHVKNFESYLKGQGLPI